MIVTNNSGEPGSTVALGTLAGGSVFYYPGQGNTTWMVLVNAGAGGQQVSIARMTDGYTIVGAANSDQVIPCTAVLKIL